MKTKAGCIFCKIVAGELPSARVYEDDHAVAFLDINPVTKGHTLIIPKEHCDDMLDAPEDLLGKLAPAIASVGRGVVEATKADGFNLLLCNGAAAGQVVFHLHYHVVPRRMGDGSMAPWTHVAYDAGEADRTADAIRAGIAGRSES